MRKERHSGVDDNGLLARLDSKQEKRLDRSIRYEYDEFDRVAKIDYGRGEIETFRYDSWGKLVEKTQSGRKAEFWYDYFGRLAEKHEEGLSTFYRYDAWGNRTARVTRTSTGLELAEERTYDRYGRLTEIRSDGKSVKYEYDRENRLARQIIDNIPVDFEYTKYNQLAAKYFGGKLQPVSTLRYFYAPDGTIVAREVGGELQRYTYDKRGQLLAVLDAQNRPVEQYTYDKAGNILEKFTNGVRTTFTYDKANQLVSSVDSKGNSKKYAYDAAGRLVKEGDRVYQYGWLDKVTQITEGDKVIRSFRYHMDGQLAAAYDDSSTETFLWDGLALIRRDTTNYLNEPAVTGGNPVIAGEKTLFNDLLGSTLGAKNADVFSAIERDAFGEVKPGETADPGINFFTGKPLVGELGYTFLFRNYRPEQGKWQTSDPLGYPDGWNNLAYVNNGVTQYIDWLGGETNYVIDESSIVTTDNRKNSPGQWETVYTSSIQSGFWGDWVQVVERKISHVDWLLLGEHSHGSATAATTTMVEHTNAQTQSATFESTLSSEVKTSFLGIFEAGVQASFTAGIGINHSATLGSGSVINNSAGHGSSIALYQEIVNIEYRTYWYYVGSPQTYEDMTILQSYSSIGSTRTGTVTSTWEYKE